MNGLYTIILSALVSVVVAYATAKASGYSKDVVEERKEWRNRIRQLTIEAVKLMLSKKTESREYMVIIGEFQVRLNPDDKDDNDILETLHRAIEAPDDLSRKKFWPKLPDFLSMTGSEPKLKVVCWVLSTNQMGQA